MLAALEAKTRRLHKILDSIKLMQLVKITDRDLLIRVAIMVTTVVVYLTTLLLVYPIEIRDKILHGERMSVCEWHETGETGTKVLLLFEVCALFLVGRTAWSLRATNAVYNESKFIGAILYGAVLLIGGYLLSELIAAHALRFMVQCYLITAMALLVVSTLMLPKFFHICAGALYHPDSLTCDSITFSSSLLTKADLRRARAFLRKFGYRVTRKASSSMSQSRELRRTRNSSFFFGFRRIFTASLSSYNENDEDAVDDKLESQTEGSVSAFSGFRRMLSHSKE